ncbi:MAG TPA: hypothetical protein VK427_03985 [Kofleriaceae bacterium]|nr:hypothetical protein [Kofleriaceae bacterium]
MQDLHKLCTKLCRELAQSEHSAMLHPRREARRLGDIPPAHALLAIASHAESLRPRFEALMAKRQPKGIKVGRAFGQVFSLIRNLFADRLIDAERSYRGTLLGCRHGVDLTRLLREVALRERDAHLAGFCDELLLARLALLEGAEQALAWFAEQPTAAIRSGARLALQPAAKVRAAHAQR